MSYKSQAIIASFFSRAAAPRRPIGKVIPSKRQKGQMGQLKSHRCKKWRLGSIAECAGREPIANTSRKPHRHDFGDLPTLGNASRASHRRRTTARSAAQAAASTATRQRKGTKPCTWLASRRILPRARWREAFLPRSFGPSWAACTMPCPSSIARCGEHPHAPARTRAVRRSTQRADA